MESHFSMVGYCYSYPIAAAAHMLILGFLILVSNADSADIDAASGSGMDP